MATYASSSLTFSGDLEHNLSDLPDNSRKAIKNIMQEEAEELEQYMKDNRPWTDRTGNARAGLKARLYDSGSNYFEIALSHSVDYGIYLEFYMGRRFAIIQPTILNKGPEVMKKFQDTMRRMVDGN